MVYGHCESVQEHGRTKVHTGKKVCKMNSKKDEKAMEPKMKKRKLDVPSMIDGET